MTSDTRSLSTHLRLCMLLAALAIAGSACTESERKEPPPAGQDGSHSARKHPLVGSWHGTTTVRNYGFVTIQVTVTSDRWIMSTVQVLGISQSVQARLKSFADDELTVTYSGQTRTIPARLAGARLTVNVPGIGEITLTRQ